MLSSLPHKTGHGRRITSGYVNQSAAEFSSMSCHYTLTYRIAVSAVIAGVVLTATWAPLSPTSLVPTYHVDIITAVVLVVHFHRLH